MITASTTHAAALRAFIVAALNLDDQGRAIVPTPFPLSSVIWTPSDHPQPLPMFATLREVANVERGPTEVRRVVDPDDPDGVALIHYEVTDWTVSVQVVSRVTSDLALSAGFILRRVWSMLDSELTAPMRDIGCAPARRGQILPLQRLAKRSDQETRAAFDLTMACGSYRVTRPGWIDSMSGQGTLDPVGTVDIAADEADA